MEETEDINTTEINLNIPSYFDWYFSKNNNVLRSM